MNPGQTTCAVCYDELDREGIGTVLCLYCKNEVCAPPWCAKDGVCYDCWNTGRKSQEH